MGRPFRRQLLVTPHLGPHPCVIYGLQLRRERPGRVGREHFAIFIISRRVPDRHHSDETGAPDSGGALNLKASIFEMHIASEQRVSVNYCFPNSRRQGPDKQCFLLATLII